MDVAAVLRFRPVDVFGNKSLRVQRYALQHEFLEPLVSRPVDQVTAVDIDGFPAQDPIGKLRPVFHDRKQAFLRQPVGEHLAHPWILLSGPTAEDDLIKVLVRPPPRPGRAGGDAFPAAHAAAGVLLHLVLIVQGKHACRRVLALSYARPAADAAVDVVDRLCAADDAEVLKMRLAAVVRAARHRNLDMIGVRIDHLFQLPGERLCVDVALDAVDAADTGHNVPGSDIGVAVLCLHLDAAQVTFNGLQVGLYVLVHRGDILCFDPRRVQCLPHPEMKGTVAPGPADVPDHIEPFRIDDRARNPELQHEFAGNFRLAETVVPQLFDIAIFYHDSNLLIHEFFADRVIEDRPVKAHIGFVDPAVAAFPDGAGHFPLEGHPDFVLGDPVRQEAEPGEFHHHGRPHHDARIIPAEGIKRDGF